MIKIVLVSIFCLVVTTIHAQKLTHFQGANSKYGFKDASGKIVVKAIYDFADAFSEGLAAICLNDKWGYIDKTGKVVIALNFESVGKFSNGLATFYHQTVDAPSGFYGYIDKSGKVVIAPRFDGACAFAEGFALVSKKDNLGYIDKTGKAICQFKYQNSSCSLFSDGLGLVTFQGKYGFINNMGEEVIPLQYDFAMDFVKGFASVQLNGRRFSIDKTGKEVK